MILVDTSAFAQTRVNSAAQQAFEDVAGVHRIATCLPVMLEVLYSAQNRSEFLGTRERFERFKWLEVSNEVSALAVDIQWQLAKRGQHRRPTADLMIAATAAVHEVPILHYDHDFDLIGEVTGQQTAWILPRGTGH